MSREMFQPNLQIISTLDNDMYRAIIALNGLCYFKPCEAQQQSSVSADCTARNRSR
ncbi:hypothetical protein J6590_053568 [Homalodisca vitripennis]|nr:hypothetical protein J6590_053568 [Homalodisca vitripennis]